MRSDRGWTAHVDARAALIPSSGRRRAWPAWRWPLPWPAPPSPPQAQNTLGGSIPGEARSGASKGYAPPTGPAPRTPAGKPDFSGVWDHPYVPDMSRSNPRNPAIQKGPGDLPYTEAGPREHRCLRSGQERRLHRDVHALRPDAVDELAVSAPDHAERQVRRLPVRAEHLVPRGAVQGRALEGPEPHLVRRVDRPVGRRHAGRGHRRLQRLHPARHPRRPAQRQAAPGADVQDDRRRPHRLHRHRGRPGLLHEAVDQRAHVHAVATTR